MESYLFPIETTSRELDFKILMALKVAAKNRQIIVGDQQYIRLLSYHLKGGVFFGKHLFGKPKFSDTNYYDRLKRRNFKLVHLNEEGAVWPGTESDWMSILQQAERPSVLTDDDYIATWGKWQKEFNKSYERTTANVVDTGHARFDLYRTQYRGYFLESTNKLNEKYGDFILVNTSFSYSNNGEGGVGFVFKTTLSYDALKVEDRIYRFKRWQQQMISISDIVELINQLNLAFPERVIILRPHPSEDTGYYESIFNNVTNVKVIYEGPVAPWIFASSLLIHNGCTTAIEATLAGKPVVNYTSLNEPLFDVFLASQCGETINNVDDVIRLVKDIEASQYVPIIPSDNISTTLLKNFTEPDTATGLAELIEKAGRSVNSKEIVLFGVSAAFTFSILFKIYDNLKYLYLLSKGQKKKYIDYKKRFEKFDKIDIEKRVESMSKILGVTVKVKVVDSHLFVIEKQ